MSRNEKHDEECGRDVQMELKYCELCGGLWLRVRGGGEVYCRNCQPMIDELPAPPRKPPQSERRTTKPRLPIGPGQDAPLGIDDLEARWAWPYAAGEL